MNETPTTQAGGSLAVLLAQADIRWPDEYTRISAEAISAKIAEAESESRVDAQMEIASRASRAMSILDRMARSAKHHPNDMVEISRQAFLHEVIIPLRTAILGEEAQ